MTRKDYILIASVLKLNFDYIDQDDMDQDLKESIKKNFIKDFIYELSHDNDNFNPKKFKEYIEGK